ncbi:PulJ/GspJ family protein [Petrocella sp. FN5]|uniref:PulJ/GspJ family protein n=1 Tax=Petrocella sp. FN5 TaxID=3032002 RepID=UPI0023D9F947|nr:type II secretion system protein [Petrocella sp. FN5]MDF1617401.1 type II secretion system protein [Petrocella sp. FN5]
MIKKEDGFTLTEIIVTIGIMSIVITMMFSFLEFNLGTLSYGSDQIAQSSNLRLTALKTTEEIRNVFEVELRDSLVGATYDKVIILENNALVIKEGSTTHHLSAGGINSVHFLMENINDRYVLKIKLQSADQAFETQVLLNNVKNAVVDGKDYTALSFSTTPPTIP